MEKIKLLLYCTKSKPYLIGRKDTPFKYYLDKGGKDSVMDARDFIHNGKIVAECDFEVEALERIGNYIRFAGVEDGEWLNNRYYEYKSCLSEEELFNYVKDKFYAIHIKNLNIFDKSRELNNYLVRKVEKDFFKVAIITSYEEINKAPQNMMYAYDKNTGDEYILISIHPEWLCKVLNGEKTIECRKRILKEMI